MRRRNAKSNQQLQRRRHLTDRRVPFEMWIHRYRSLACASTTLQYVEERERGSGAFRTEPATKRHRVRWVQTFVSLVLEQLYFVESHLKEADDHHLAVGDQRLGFSDPRQGGDGRARSFLQPADDVVCLPAGCKHRADSR